MHCNRCGHDNDEGARFCSSCGNPLDAAEDTGAAEDVETTSVDPEELEAEAAVAVETLAAADAGAAPVETVVVEADAEEAVAEKPAVPAAEEAVAEEAVIAEEATDAAPERQPLPDAPGAPVPPDQSHPAAGPAPEARRQTPPPPVQPPAGAPSAGPVPPSQPPVPPTAAQRGILGQAWHDLTGSQGWFGRVVVLILMNLVPVLGWYVSGYMLQWGASAGDGSEGLPRRSFSRSTVWLGFLYAVLGLIGAVATASLFYVGAVPVLGPIFLFCWAVLVSVYTTVAGVRMAARGSFGAAFDLSDILEAFKRDPWGAIVAVFVPGLAAGAVIVVVAMLVLTGAAGSMYASSYYLYSGSYYGYGLDPLSTVAAMLGILGPAVVIVALAAAFAGTFAQLWSVRAVGVWIDRNAPQWKRAPREGRGIGFRSE
ncbi:zinc-ribbon domain-containing protein [Caniella muris]|uniref:zinc-ribbon domain-containing protein n=1 Tax=Caniella muris TaxID=2941502 RepID=UPI00203BB7DD|nr:zinc-ribbon domain-containing protein [Caniella muris]